MYTIQSRLFRDRLAHCCFVLQYEFVGIIQHDDETKPGLPRIVLNSLMCEYGPLGSIHVPTYHLFSQIGISRNG